MIMESPALPVQYISLNFLVIFVNSLLTLYDFVPYYFSCKRESSFIVILLGAFEPKALSFCFVGFRPNEEAAQDLVSVQGDKWFRCSSHVLRIHWHLLRSETGKTLFTAEWTGCFG